MNQPQFPNKNPQFQPNPQPQTQPQNPPPPQEDDIGIVGLKKKKVGGKAGNTMQKIGQWGNVAGAGLGALGQGLGQIGSSFGLKKL